MNKLLLVFAHPDDESFSCGGTIAEYVEAGWRVDLLCATRGEEGERGPLVQLAREKVGETRQKELEKAGTVLGIHSITFLGYKDGTLTGLTPGILEEEIRQKMIEFVPDVVITFDTTGVSNHPDHVKISFAATYAFQKYAAWIEEQLESVEETEQIFPKLYYTCMPESIVAYEKKNKNIPAESFGKPWVGVSDKAITTVIDIREYGEIKKKALLCHVTQIADVERFLSNPNQPLLSREYYILRLHGTTEVFMGKNDRVSGEL